MIRIRMRRSLGFIWATTLWLGLTMQPYAVRAAEQTETTKSVKEMNDVFQYIEQFHLSDVKEEKLKDAAIKGMIDSLQDPYTQYFSAKEWKDFEASLEMNYVGIGVRLDQDARGIFIAEVFPGSPAEAAGLLVNDVFIEVEGQKITGSKVEELISKVVGPENTKVNITIKRDQTAKKFTIARQKIQLPIIKSIYFPNQIGYIRLYSFSTQADEEFAKALDEMQQKGLKSLIIDLRDNGGGLLDTAANIAKKFIKQGVLIHELDRNGQGDTLQIKNGTEVAYPVFMLLNQNSASASEVLAGALQDYKVAKVIGTQSFGKGSVQQIVPLTTGGVLKLTIREYLTPHKRKVNKQGITPDIDVQSDAAQLIAALRHAGLKQWTVKLNAKQIEINGQLVPANIQTLQAGGKWYVPTRFITELAGQKLTWNAEKQVIEIPAETGTLQFSLTSPYIKVESGISYLDIDYFVKHFSNLTYTVQNDSIVLQVN